MMYGYRQDKIDVGHYWDLKQNSLQPKGLPKNSLRQQPCSKENADVHSINAFQTGKTSGSILLKSLLNLCKAYIDLCLLNRPKPSSFRSLLLNFTLDQAFIFFSMVRHCLWKMSATPGACIKPGLVRRPLCHKVNLPSCVARRPFCHKVNLRVVQLGNRCATK